MNALKKVLGVVSLMAFLSGCSTVTGVVRDKPTGNPISSATVTIGSSSSVTNAMGAYSLSGPFVPQNVMMINAPGYNIYTTSLGNDRVKDIELVPR